MRMDSGPEMEGKQAFPVRHRDVAPSETKAARFQGQQQRTCEEGFGDEVGRYLPLMDSARTRQNKMVSSGDIHGASRVRGLPYLRGTRSTPYFTMASRVRLTQL